MKILVIDHHDIPQGVAPLLHRIVPPHEGLAMLESSTLESGLEYCDQHEDLDLVLLDLMLPDKRGMEALDTILERHPRLHVAVIFDASQPRLAVEALQHGARACIPKPSTAEAFVGTLQALLPGTRKPHAAPLSRPAAGLATPTGGIRPQNKH